MMIKKIILFSIFLTTLGVVNAQTTRSVASEGEFNAALNASSAGDTIEWENGTYSDVYMDIDVEGVTVKSETSGGVIFNGSSRALLDVDDITFTGMQFVGGDILDGSDDTIPQTVITIDGSNVTVSHINISEYTCWKYIRIRDSSQNTEVTYCNFENRLNYANQNIFQVDVNSSQPGYHNINYCSFKNFSGVTTGGDDGVEPIRIGASSQASYLSKSIVEYCYFTGCEGDGEIISHKATECIYRYNTFENNIISELVLRHGDNAIVYGNFFMNNKGGVRVQEGSDHAIYNNYFNNLSSRSVYLSDDDSDPVENVLIAYNTFVNTENLRLSGGGDNQAPTNTILANNVFSNSGSEDVIDDATGEETWTGNIYNGNIGITVPASGLVNTNPELFLNTEGFYTIDSDSPVINKGAGGYILNSYIDFEYDNEIALDIIGTSRPSVEAMKDIGCQEYDATAVLKPHVTEANTGPDYFIDDSILSVSSEELSINGFDFYPNPIVDNTINLSFNLEKEAKVKVDVYDISGKKLLGLIDTTYSRGNQVLNSKINLETGLYLIYTQITSGGNTATKIEKILKQ